MKGERPVFLQVPGHENLGRENYRMQWEQYPNAPWCRTIMRAPSFGCCRKSVLGIVHGVWTRGCLLILRKGHVQFFLLLMFGFSPVLKLEQPTAEKNWLLRVCGHFLMTSLSPFSSSLVSHHREHLIETVTITITAKHLIETPLSTGATTTPSKSTIGPNKFTSVILKHRS